MKNVIGENPLPLAISRRFPPYRETWSARENRANVVRLHYEGWVAKSIAGYLKTHK